MENKCIFDVLTFDIDRGNYEGKVEIQKGYFIDVTISVESFDKDLVFEVAENTFETIKVSEELYKEKIAEDLLQLHNEVWNEGRMTNKDEFKKRIKMQGMLIFCEGNAELYYDDGDLFWGHTIVVDIDENGLYQDAQIFG
ncbi:MULTISPECIES: DUF2262 domain-containing protein [unclassified Psychrobacillus]|uniref:DUF2262 domain-containing protein n=1 Tax=unclassified Psychrobacillus TaxID=2636677 RepID=UPI0011A4F16C|nr:DUF2262 domain-containing protein [Psychrobacillus sp. AK 1817]QEY22353.1 DUF2262 domain-containing protein [Psychrobacillus sp. AK 1817]QGM29240.1 DUF2262 domain-containing protein [Bacillus sp. N3536]